MAQTIVLFLDKVGRSTVSQVSHNQHEMFPPRSTIVLKGLVKSGVLISETRYQHGLIKWKPFLKINDKSDID